MRRTGDWCTGPRTTRSPSSRATRTGSVFDYQSSNGRIQLGRRLRLANGHVKTQVKALPRQFTDTARFEQTIVASFCGDTFVGLHASVRQRGCRLVLDNLLVEDLGEASTIRRLRTLTGELTPT